MRESHGAQLFSESKLIFVLLNADSVEKKRTNWEFVLNIKSTMIGVIKTWRQDSITDA